MTEQLPDSFSPDPERCLWAGPARVGSSQFCKVCDKWCNCLAVGCFVRPDGSTCEFDNGPEACGRRLRAIKEEE